MKKLLTIILCLMISNIALAGGQVRKICHPAITKTGHPILDRHHHQLQRCKTIIIHKKLTGNTKVPSI